MPSPIVQLVERYAQRIYPAVLTQQTGQSISSPLGIWLLLAAVAPVSTGERRAALEDTLGCEANEAGQLFAQFVENCPNAVKTAVALWLADGENAERLHAWTASLPRAVDVTRMPDQAGADAWATEHTDGLITKFPVEITGLTRLILTSALACSVSWVYPFDVAPADELVSSRWQGTVTGVLKNSMGRMLLCDTEQAGLVAVYHAQASEGLDVIAVAGDPDVDPGAVLEATHDVQRLLANKQSTARLRSLFDVDAGEGHSWVIVEEEVATFQEGDREEQYDTVVLPAWHADGELDLRKDGAFGVAPALATLIDLLGAHPEGDVTSAKQVATASYTKEGFVAAAITAFGVRAAGMRPMREARGLRRTCSLRFQNPFSVIAFTAPVYQENVAYTRRDDDGLAVFSAWVAAPVEA